MTSSLLIDIGSTYTKVAAVDLEQEEVIGTARAFTTIGTDVREGLSNATKDLEQRIGKRDYDIKLACSSAAGGLKIVTVGLVKELTAKASEMAALNAGAKVLKVFSYTLVEEDLKEIENLDPDIILLAGGIDGGNKEVIIHNAGCIAKSHLTCTVIMAGNKAARVDVVKALKAGHKNYVITDNVMPDYNELNIEPARSTIRQVFLDQIIQAKGLSLLADELDDVIIPTPSAVLKAMALLAFGTDTEDGIGPLMGLDVGGATTDIYSMAKQKSYQGNTMMKGLPEPTEKRTVEGDLGLKYSLDTLYKYLPKEARGDINQETFETYLHKIKENPSHLPMERERLMEQWLTYGAVKEGVNRHVGRLETTYTLDGPLRYQIGKDLTTVTNIIGTGGPIIDGKQPEMIMEGALYDVSDENRLKPREGQYYIDEHYIMSAMGLLSIQYPEKALRLLKKSLRKTSNLVKP